MTFPHRRRPHQRRDLQAREVRPSPKVAISVVPSVSTSVRTVIGSTTVVPATPATSLVSVISFTTMVTSLSSPTLSPSSTTTTTLSSSSSTRSSTTTKESPSAVQALAAAAPTPSLSSSLASVSTSTSTSTSSVPSSSSTSTSSKTTASSLSSSSTVSSEDVSSSSTSSSTTSSLISRTTSDAVSSSSTPIVAAAAANSPSPSPSPPPSPSDAAAATPRPSSTTSTASPSSPSSTLATATSSPSPSLSLPPAAAVVVASISSQSASILSKPIASTAASVLSSSGLELDTTSWSTPTTFNPTSLADTIPSSLASSDGLGGAGLGLGSLTASSSSDAIAGAATKSSDSATNTPSIAPGSGAATVASNNAAPGSGSQQPPTSGHSVAVAGGVVGAFVAVGLSVLVFFLLRRGKLRKPLLAQMRRAKSGMHARRMSSGPAPSFVARLRQSLANIKLGMHEGKTGAPQAETYAALHSPGFYYNRTSSFISTRSSGVIGLAHTTCPHVQRAPAESFDAHHSTAMTQAESMDPALMRILRTMSGGDLRPSSPPYQSQGPATAYGHEDLDPTTAYDRNRNSLGANNAYGRTHLNPTIPAVALVRSNSSPSHSLHRSSVASSDESDSILLPPPLACSPRRTSNPFERALSARRCQSPLGAWRDSMWSVAPTNVPGSGVASTHRSLSASAGLTLGAAAAAGTAIGAGSTYHAGNAGSRCASYAQRGGLSASDRSISGQGSGSTSDSVTPRGLSVSSQGARGLSVSSQVPRGLSVSSQGVERNSPSPPEASTLYGLHEPVPAIPQQFRVGSPRHEVAPSPLALASSHSAEILHTDYPSDPVHLEDGFPFPAQTREFPAISTNDCSVHDGLHHPDCPAVQGYADERESHQSPPIVTHGFDHLHGLNQTHGFNETPSFNYPLVSEREPPPPVPPPRNRDRLLRRTVSAGTAVTLNGPQRLAQISPGSPVMPDNEFLPPTAGLGPSSAPIHGGVGIALAGSPASAQAASVAADPFADSAAEDVETEHFTAPQSAPLEGAWLRSQPVHEPTSHSSSVYEPHPGDLIQL